MTANGKKKVFVGLSGGVDSSVSAALLQKEGYDVTGVFIKTWHPNFLPCTWKDDRRDAMAVAAHLGIPFLTFDAEAEYKKEVADAFLADYARGRTPNPDVLCNKHVKFGAFLKFAKEQGADFVATGHYARNLETRRPSGESVFSLLAGIDKNKDQSYFLWMLGADELKHILFPVGDLEKPRVRELAREFGLPTAEKKDSQGVCFLGELNMKEFLKRYVSPKKGEVLNEKGDSIGHHDGAIFHTLGERRGFTITKKGTNDAPYYVIAKDMAKNTITVSHREAGELPAEKEYALENLNWIGETPAKTERFDVRYRYRGALLPGSFMPNGDGSSKVVFENMPEPVARGQSVVFYRGEELKGGGIVV